MSPIMAVDVYTYTINSLYGYSKVKCANIIELFVYNIFERSIHGKVFQGMRIVTCSTQQLYFVINFKIHMCNDQP